MASASNRTITDAIMDEGEFEDLEHENITAEFDILEGDIGHNYWLHASTFTLWTLLVAGLTTVIVTKFMKSSANPSDEFFAGGRGLMWYIVAGSLLLTNLSTGQLVGLNGVIFKDGCLAGIAWETFAALAMCVTSIVFLPTYSRSGFITTSGFLGQRFDTATRTCVSVIFLVYYTIVICPMVLYTGGLAVKTIFDLHHIPLWVVSTLIGVLGSIYALTGGLKAVAVSDCLNGVGLIFFGIWVPIAALNKIGGFGTLFEEPALLKPFVTRSMIWDNDKKMREEGGVSLPWGVLVTGLMIQNLYYWSTNQVIVQRVLGAKSLSHGQKGVMFAALMKVIGFAFLCLPGVIGILMVDRGTIVDGKPFKVELSDQVYPLVVKACMPKWSLGLFAAVVLGSVLSTFNSALNSASTLFGLEIYKIYVNPEASDERVVSVATVFGVVLSLFSYVAAPFLEGLGSIFDYLQKVNAMTSLPIVTIFVIGIATSRPDAFAAKLGFAVGVLAYGSAHFLEGDFVPHWLHLFFICFVGAMLTIMVATYAPFVRRCFGQNPYPEPYETPAASDLVDTTPWDSLYPYSLAILVLVTIISVSFQFGSATLFYIFWLCWIIALLVLMFLPVSEADENSYEESKDDDNSSEDHEDEG